MFCIFACELTQADLCTEVHLDFYKFLRFSIEIVFQCVSRHGQSFILVV
jgi:hypothetical protein